MRAAVIFEGSALVKQLAEAVAEGARNAGAEASVTDFAREKPAKSDFVFAGFEHEKKAEEAMAAIAGCGITQSAVFCLKGADAAKITEFFSSKGLRVADTLTIRPSGGVPLFRGAKISEDDLVRAQAFGERIMNRAQQKRVTQPSEKHRISGYFKPQQ